MNSATLAEKAEQCGAEVGRYEGTMVWVKFHSPSSLEAFAAAIQRTEQQANPWRQAVDEALIAHALDCTGPGDDPKEKVKELIEWAVTIATDPRVSETAAREQEASATGAEPAGFLAYQGAVSVFYPSMSILSVETKRWNPPVSKIVPLYATPTTSTTGKDLTDGAVFHLASRIANLINRHDGKAETLMPELRALVLAVTGKVDASRVRDEALSEAVQVYESEEVLAPVGNSAWGEAYQEGWISGAQAYREAIRSLIGTPKSAEGEGA
jgi:hypothetical protein